MIRVLVPSLKAKKGALLGGASSRVDRVVSADSLWENPTFLRTLRGTAVLGFSAYTAYKHHESGKNLRTLGVFGASAVLGHLGQLVFLLPVALASGMTGPQSPALGALGLASMAVGTYVGSVAVPNKIFRKENPEGKEHPYLSLGKTVSYEKMAKERGVSTVARSASGFLSAYKKAGRKENLSPFWREKREGFVRRHLAQIEKNREPLFLPDGTPTRRHLALIMWAYSPVPKKL